MLPSHTTRVIAFLVFFPPRTPGQSFKTLFAQAVPQIWEERFESLVTLSDASVSQTTMTG